MKNTTILLCILCSINTFAQPNNTAKLSLRFINNVDDEVSIKQMPNPGSGLQHGSLLAMIDSTTQLAHFEFELHRATDFYWVSKVNQLGGMITLSPGDDLLMSIDRDQGYRSLSFNGNGALWNNFRFSISLEHNKEDGEIFELAEKGEISFSQVIKQKMILLDKTLKNIDARSLQSDSKNSNELIENFKLERTYETYQELYLYLSWFKLEISPEDKVFLSKIDVNNDKAATSSRAYMSVISRYFFSKYRESYPKMKFDQKAFAEKLLTGETLETWKADRIISKIQRGFAKPEDIFEALEELKRPVVLEDLDHAILLFERSKISDFALGTQFIEGEFTSINQIIKRFEGKVIYIDFWGSWCGPCVSNMPNNLRIQKEFASKDVVFLFLAGNDKEVYWKRAIKQNQISGYHFLLNDELLKEATKMFDIQGFPAHSLVDKFGKIIDKHPGRRANIELFKKIEALLK